MRRLSIALLCFGAIASGILLAQNRQSLRIDQLREVAAPLVQPLLQPLTPIFDQVKPIWESIKDNPLSHGLTSIGTASTISLISKYVIDYALRKKDEVSNAIINEKDKLLANHTGEIETLTDANKLLTDQTENARLKQERAELKWETAQTTIAELKEREQRLIQERNLAQKALADVDKLKAEIKEERRLH